MIVHKVMRTWNVGCSKQSGKYYCVRVVGNERALCSWGDCEKCPPQETELHKVPQYRQAHANREKDAKYSTSV